MTFALGDENGDLLNDYTDFRLFKADYIAANGAAAFSSMIATEGGYVPEPSTFELMVVGGGALCFALRGVQGARLFRFSDTLLSRRLRPIERNTSLPGGHKWSF